MAKIRKIENIVRYFKTNKTESGSWYIDTNDRLPSDRSISEKIPGSLQCSKSGRLLVQNDGSLRITRINY